MKVDANAAFLEGFEMSPAVAIAATTAAEAHARQTRRGTGKPYITHPTRVWMMAVALGMGDSAQMAAFTHDVVEDCPEWPMSRLGFYLDARAAFLVIRLTKPKTVLSAEEKLAYYAGIIADEDASVLKLLDRADNLREALQLVENDATFARNYWVKTASEFTPLMESASSADASAQTVAALALCLGAHEALGKALDAQEVSHEEAGGVRHAE